MKDDLLRSLTTQCDRHREGVFDEITSHVLVNRPANDSARVRVEHRGQIQPSFPRAQVGDIAHPNLIERPDVEASLHDVNGVGVRAVDDGRGLPTLGTDAFKTELRHHLGDGLARNDLAVLAQVHQDLRGSRHLVGLAVKPGHFRFEALVTERSRRGRPVAPSVVTGP